MILVYLKPALAYIYLSQVASIVNGETQDIYIMQQADTPAFLFYPRYRKSLGEKAHAWFFRRNISWNL